MASETKHAKGLLDILERLAEAGRTHDFNWAMDLDNVPRAEREIARLLGEILNNYQVAAEYDLMKYKLISDSLGIAHWNMDVVNKDPVNPGNKFAWSREFRNMLGFSDENDFPDVLSSWSNRLHPEDRVRVLDSFAAHLDDRTGTTPYNLKCRLMMKNGEYRWFHILGATMRDKDGTPLRVAGALEDINDKTLIQDQMREAEERMQIELRDTMLNTQAHWYKSILDAMPFPISVTDTNMNWTFVNKATENMLGTRREDMLGKPCSGWNAYICNTDDCGIVSARRGVKQTFLVDNGVSYKVDVEILRDLEGAVAGYIEIVHDITAVEMMARERADAANKAKTIFLATMSHEMRTPLNAIIGMTAIGRKSDGIDRKNYAFDKIEDASTHLLGVISDILDMSKIEANKLELSSVEFNFEQMLQRVIAVINHRVSEKRQKFFVNVDKNVPRFIIGDDQRLAQIITNLLSNAVKFTHENGRVGLHVSLAEEKNGINELRIEVIDNGIGISTEQQAKLFSAFGQADSGISREFGGTGLGLAISKHLVALMGGKIWVESALGKGSRFIFTIRVPGGEKNLCSLLNPGVEWEKVRVMAVDDSSFIRRLFKESFERLGMQCETAEDGSAACRIIQERGDFDIYFIDWYMPNMNGVELTKWIKAREKPCSVVLISSANWEELKELSLNSGADKCLAKPIMASALVECMNECFGFAHKGDNAGPRNEFAGKTLLLAEDVEINREIVMSLLEGTGLTIDCVENGKEALARVEADPGRYDIVFMDMQMPLMDGLEATRRIRALSVPRCGSLPIIAMTANVFKDDIENCLAAGMNDHIGKPLDIKDLFRILHKYVSK